MKAIRRSLKSDKDRDITKTLTPSHQSLPAKTATAIVPPKKVIKALYDYEPTSKNGHELAFRKGDFFHVLNREDDTEWYEACNPLIPTARGLVPVAYFDVIGKQQRASDQSLSRREDAHDSGYSEKGTSAPNEQPNASNNTSHKTHMRQTSMMKAHAMVYGIVVYDFQSERPDELDAKAGEPIIVVAQSNPEWFVAKPIGRLGGPGLIPVSYVELKDTVTGKAVTDPLAAVRAAGVPRVEEWKKTAAEYKNNSITLGEITQARTGQTLQHQQQQQRHQQQQPDVNGLSQNMENMNIQQRKVSLHSQAWQSTDESQQQPPLPHPTGPLAPRSACVPRYCFDNDQYWYIIECEMEDGRCWELSRYYADFYDFQIKLLSMFPREAGTEGNGERLLPYMPGPVAHVTDAISNGRRENLDIYIKQVIKLPAYISKCILVRELFEPRDQDYEIDPAALNENFRLSAQSMAPSLSASQARSSTSSHPRSSAGVYTSNVPLPQTHKRGPSMGATPNGSHPALHTQASSLTTNSAVSQKPQANSGAALRIKVEFQEEIVAIRVPSNIDFDQLQSKVMERLRISPGADVVIKYRDDQAGTVAPLNDNTDLDTAIQRNANLRLVVAYA